MKKPEIKYVGWCHECKCMGSFICGNCKPNEKYSFARPSEFISIFEQYRYRITYPTMERKSW